MNKKLLLIIFGISGMTALIYEMMWIRPLSLIFGTTMYAVSTIVASFILGLAMGSWIAGRFTDGLQNPLKYFALIQKTKTGYQVAAIVPKETKSIQLNTLGITKSSAEPIWIVAVGKQNLINSFHVSENQVIVDVGINRLDDGRVVGDVDFDSVRDTVAAITPVPGGIGPLNVYSLFKNLLSISSK